MKNSSAWKGAILSGLVMGETFNWQNGSFSRQCSQGNRQALFDFWGPQVTKEAQATKKHVSGYFSARQQNTEPGRGRVQGFYGAHHKTHGPRISGPTIENWSSLPVTLVCSGSQPDETTWEDSLAYYP